MNVGDNIYGTNVEIKITSSFTQEMESSGFGMISFLLLLLQTDFGFVINIV